MQDDYIILVFPHVTKFPLSYFVSRYSFHDLQLGLLRGKGLFFVNSTDAGYRLKLFLEQFHIRSAVLNAELPLRSRLSVIDQFNVGNFDYLIATDESTDAGLKKTDDDDDSDDSGDEEGGDRKRKNKRSRKKRKKDVEYGVSRGLDFRDVSFVVNVDLPLTVESYTHRVGRTARGGARGVALSLVEAGSEEQGEVLERVRESQPRLQGAGAVGAGIDDGLRTSAAPIVGELGCADSAIVVSVPDNQAMKQPLPLDFDLNEIEGFRYRVEDVGRAVTAIAVRDARAAELKAEILNSDRLRGSYFEENPADLRLLRHDRTVTSKTKIQDHLKHVPTYMLPRGMRPAPTQRRKKRKIRGPGYSTKADPLRSYEGGEVNLDGVTGDGDEVSGSMVDGPTSADAEYFDDDDGGADELNSSKNHKGSSREEGSLGKMFMDASDGTGKSTSGRNAWKAKRGRGKFSAKYKREEAKHLRGSGQHE